MKNKLSINNKIDAALSSVENIQQVPPPSFFYTRLMGKISSSKLPLLEKFSTFLLQPAITFAAVCFIIIVNAFVLFYSNSNNIAAANQTEVTSADEYSDVATSFYDLENIKP